MANLGFQRPRKSPWEILLSSLVSLVLVLLSQFALALVPRLFPSLSLLSMLPISGLAFVASVAVGRIGKKLLGVSALAPALVLFNILFVWGVYIAVIRHAMSSFPDAVFNVECALLLVGFFRILSGDPGVVACDSSSSVLHNPNSLSEANLQHENSTLFTRVRYCNSCKTSVRGFDHHCPAFGNCIGQDNHRLFMVLLIGFVIVEASYSISSSRYITNSLNMQNGGLERNLPGNFVISTVLFCVLQLLWQVVFLLWHAYCICFNIKTDEWINWKKYPEFQIVIQPQPGSPFSETQFSNPYDKGIIGNIHDFLKPKEYRLI